MNILEFVTILNNNNIFTMIEGGQAFKKYFNSNEKTEDYDIHIYINYSQLNDKNLYKFIYDKIKILYNFSYKNVTDILPLSKFDYAKYSKKYIDNKLLNNEIEYYSSNIICDLQIESITDTLVDICICYSPDIEEKKKMIGNDYYIKQNFFIKDTF